MPAKWQQWMPFRIDAFKGSPAVQAMHPCARIGYLYLLACAWQTEDCTLSCDPLELAEQSGLGDELWALHGQRILRKFGWTEDHERLCNEVLLVEWKEAKRVFDARKSSADRINSLRSPNADRDGEVSAPLRSADTRTGTGTGTVTEVQQQKPSANKSRRRKAKPEPGDAKEPSKSAIEKGRHGEFKAIIAEYWDSKNPGVQMPWDGREGKNLELWLKSAPEITASQFRGFLRSRFKSEVNHGERASAWIGWVTKFAAGPIDRFGQPLSTTGGTNGKQAGKIEANLNVLANCLAGLGNHEGTNGSSLLPGSTNERDVPEPR